MKFYKRHFFIIVLLCVLSCSSAKMKTDSKATVEFEVVKTSLVIEKDTLTFNELRFYKVESALDAMKLMYLNYGKWNKKISGKYQSNINRIIWNDVKLFGDNEVFTVVADGTETLSDYFASLVVFDSEDKDCFNTGHPSRAKLINLFAAKMKSLDKNQSVYNLFR